MNPLRIYTEYLPNSNAAGVMYGFFYIGKSGIDFSRSAYFTLSRNDSLNYELPSPLPTGVYYVHTYAIGQDGLLINNLPATTVVFSRTGGSQGIASLASYIFDNAVITPCICNDAHNNIVHASRC